MCNRFFSFFLTRKHFQLALHLFASGFFLFLWKWVNCTGLEDGAYVIDYNGNGSCRYALGSSREHSGCFVPNLRIQVQCTKTNCCEKNVESMGKLKCTPVIDYKQPSKPSEPLKKQTNFNLRLIITVLLVICQLCQGEGNHRGIVCGSGVSG